MSDAPMTPDPLNKEFCALKTRATPPGDDLMARVLADADAVQAEILAPPRSVRKPFTVRFMAFIGGWPSMAGLATAGLAGVWIGVSQPAALVQTSETLIYGDLSGAMVDIDPFFGLSDQEGGL